MVSDFAIEHSRPGMEPLKTGIGCWHEEACWHKILGVCRNWAICWQYEGYICINAWIWYFNFRLVVNVHFLLPKYETLCINRVNHSIQYEGRCMTWTLFYIDSWNNSYFFQSRSQIDHVFICDAVYFSFQDTLCWILVVNCSSDTVWI